MKASVYNTIHRFESITDWFAGDCILAVDSAQKKEGVYSIKMTAEDNNYASMRYDKAYDWSMYTHISFSVYHPGWTNEYGWIAIYTDAANYDFWTFNFAATWTTRIIDLSAGEGEVGTLDLSNIAYFIIFQMNLSTPGEDYYFDYLYGHRDVESKVSECKIRSPTARVPYTRFHMVCSPNDESYFINKDTIVIKDDSDVIAFAGRLYGKRDMGAFYSMRAKGWDHELRTAMYQIATSSSKSSEKLESMIDKSAFTYYSGSIEATTLDYSYDIKKNYNYMIAFFRWMERAVYYSVLEESECKAYFKKSITDVNLLPLATLIFPATYDFRDDTVGETGTSISWVDTTGDAADISIIASEDGHKKVMKMTNSNWARHYNSFTARTAGVIELHWKKSNVAGQCYIAELSESGVSNIIFFTSGNGIWYDGVGAAADSTFDYVADTWYHIKIQWTAGDVASVWVDGVLIIDAVAMNAQTGGINRFGITTDNNAMDVYYDAIGYSWDTNYTEGDNLAQLSDSIYCQGLNYVGKHELDIGLTRVAVFGGINSKGEVYYIASSAAPEQEEGIMPTYPFTDSAIMNYTEAKQIGDNLLAIFGTSQLFIELIVEGRGFLQPWYRVRFANKTPSVPVDDFAIVEWVYDAKGDVYDKFIISNGIAYNEEFRAIQKQMLFRDDIINAEFINSAAPVSTEDGTVIPGNRFDRSVWRVPEPDAWDFDKDALAAIGDVAATWYDLDLSAILPVGATAVRFRIEATDNLKGSHLMIRKNGQVGEFQVACITSTVGGEAECDSLNIDVDSDRKLEFNCDPKASDWTSIDLVVLGWKI